MSESLERVVEKHCFRSRKTWEIAIIAYLTRGRARSDHNHIFVASNAPVRPGLGAPVYCMHAPSRCERRLQTPPLRRRLCPPGRVHLVAGGARV